jgi:hypothetical protein
MIRTRTLLPRDFVSAICVILAVTIPAVAQLEARSQTTTFGPIYIAAADFNHDGKMDIAISTVGAGTYPLEVQVFLGNGDGTFGPPTAYDVNEAAGPLAVGDFNNDGNADLAVLQSGVDGPWFVSVLLGNGDGTFQAPANYTLTAAPYGLTLGDFNGDGFLDIATTTYTEGCACVAVLLGNGDGTFQEPAILTNLQAGAGPLVAGHFGASKNLDLAAVVSATLSSEAVQILLGNGDGTFSLGDSYPLSALDTESIIAADFRNNGKTDLAVPEFEGMGVAVLLGNGNGTFQQPVVYDLTYAWGVVAADMNGDGILDLVASTTGLNPGGVGIFYGNGDGTFQNAALYPTGDWPNGIAVADFNGDHMLDVVTADRFGDNAEVLLNTGVVSFSPTSPLTFPTQLLGTKSKVITASLTNNGTSALTISSITLQGKPFAMQTTCGDSVAVGGSCKISATFTPKAQGSASGTVTINDSASSKSMVIELLGTGTVVEFTPDGLTFPAQEVGTTSAPQTIQLTNIGKTALDFTYFMYVGGNDYNDFSETNNCPTDLNAGASCTITVTFTPKKTGTRTAAVYVTDNAGGSPQTVPLTGTGD